MKKNKKILFINDFEIGGGAEEIVKQTVKILQDKYDIRTFYGNKKYKKATSLREYVYSKFYYNKLLQFLFDYEPDVIFLANYYHILSPSILNAIKKYKLKKNIKVIMVSHDFHVLCPNSGFRYFSWFSDKFFNFKKNPSFIDLLIKKYDERSLFYSIAKQIQWIYSYKILKLDKVIDIFVSPSEFLASFLKEKYNNVYIIRNPLPSDIIFEKNIKSNKRNSNSEIKLIFIGRVSKEKGLLPFIKKLKEVKNIRYSFTIIGEGGEYLEQLKSFVEREKISDKIFFKNRMSRKEILKKIEKYDVLVLPSLCYENAPLSLVEGAIKGLGLLTMNYGGMKEIAEICGNYFLLNENYSNLQEALNFFKNYHFVNNFDKLIYTFSIEIYKKELINIIERLQ